MTDQLDWFRQDDWTKASRCKRYQIKRYLSHEKFPASSYEYKPQRVGDTTFVIGEGRYAKVEDAMQACEDDLKQLQRVAASTKG